MAGEAINAPSRPLSPFFHLAAGGVHLGREEGGGGGKGAGCSRVGAAGEGARRGRGAYNDFQLYARVRVPSSPSPFPFVSTRQPSLPAAIRPQRPPSAPPRQALPSPDPPSPWRMHGPPPTPTTYCPIPRFFAPLGDCFCRAIP